MEQIRQVTKRWFIAFEQLVEIPAPTPELTPAIEEKEACTAEEEEIPARADDDGPRVDWRPLDKISDIVLCELVLDYCDPAGRVPVECTDVLWRSQGAFNYIVCVGLFRASQLEQYVIRIPGHGNAAAWTDEDAYNLNREVDIMTFVGQDTDVPVPTVYGHDATCDNSIGAPFILMDKVNGHDAFDLWFDQPYDVDTAWRTADESSPEVEAKRINFLQSLAKIMSSMNKLTFTRIGLPIDEDSNARVTAPYPAGPSHHFESRTNVHKSVTRPAFSTTQAFIEYGMDQFFDEDDDLATKGARKILELVFAQPAFNPDTESETFTLHHNDLDLQNIMVDLDGNIVGIIDWDGAYAAPRCIGADAVPKFLRKDWMPDYANGLDKSPFMAWNTEHYRKLYAAALLDADKENPDVQFTTKSAIYQAAVGVLFEDGDVHSFADKVLREVPGVRMDAKDVKVGLGRGWPACEKMLEREIKKILAPELPKVEYLEEARKAAMEEDDEEQEDEDMEGDDEEDKAQDKVEEAQEEEEDVNKENEPPQGTLSDSDDDVEAME